MITCKTKRNESQRIEMKLRQKPSRPASQSRGECNFNFQRQEINKSKRNELKAAATAAAATRWHQQSIRCVANEIAPYLGVICGPDSSRWDFRGNPGRRRRRPLVRLQDKDTKATQKRGPRSTTPTRGLVLKTRDSKSKSPKSEALAMSVEGI